MQLTQAESSVLARTCPAVYLLCAAALEKKRELLELVPFFTHPS